MIPPIANVQDHVVPVKRGVLEAYLALINAYLAHKYQWLADVDAIQRGESECK